MSTTNSRILNPAVIVAALGNFVDVYDLVLFGVVRVSSLKDMGLTGDAATEEGIFLLNVQMIGMLIGGILWGVLGDKKGRLSVLFGSIIMYSVANIANGMVNSMEMYAVWRFIAGVGLAGELGAGITLVTEVMPKEKRGYGAMIVAAVGLLGAVAAAITAGQFEWRTAYFVGGGLGLMLLLLRVSVRESEMFQESKNKSSNHGNFFLLFSKWSRFKKYVQCILMGLPIWYVIGIPIVLSPEFARILGVEGEVSVGTAVMLSYGGAAIGDLLSGTLSQILKSRLKVMVVFLILDASVSLVYHTLWDASLDMFYAIFFFFGLAGGFWLMLLTISAEQFGTNIRATVTTTVPNFVRGGAVLINLVFLSGKIFLENSMGYSVEEAFYYSSLFCLALFFGTALLSVRGMDETFSVDMDFNETDDLVDEKTVQSRQK